jgi:hypothetical protein
MALMPALVVWAVAVIAVGMAVIIQVLDATAVKAFPATFDASVKIDMH